jgi:hypothetical protein
MLKTSPFPHSDFTLFNFSIIHKHHTRHPWRVQLMRFISRCTKGESKRGRVLGLQSATNVMFQDLKEPINVLHETLKDTELWLGFASGDITILKLANKSLPKRWRAHPGGVLCIQKGTNTVWSGEHYVLDHYPSCSTLISNHSLIISTPIVIWINILSAWQGFSWQTTTLSSWKFDEDSWTLRNVAH